MTQIEPRPILFSPEQGKTFEVEMPNRMEKHLANNIGVLAGVGPNGGRHAVAWDSKQIIDPQERLILIDDFQIQVFFRFGLDVKSNRI